MWSELLRSYICVVKISFNADDVTSDVDNEITAAVGDDGDDVTLTSAELWIIPEIFQKNNLSKIKPVTKDLK